MTDYIYLHGFASGPNSAKAQYFSDRFCHLKLNLKIPDLNQGDFSRLTLSRQLQQVPAYFPALGDSVTIIGSSFGGLTAAYLAEKHSLIQRLILLAPAFGFLSHLVSYLGEAQVKQWQDSGYLSVYHYGEGRLLPLGYQFLTDLSLYSEQQLTLAIPTLIFHGLYDDVIPIQSSRDYASIRPWVQLIELESDHNLTNVLPQIWQATQDFCQLE